MKKLNEKVKYTTDGDKATLYARRADTGKLAPAFTCHAATIPLLKKDGLTPHLRLLKCA